jgi:DNA-nicking Smr family endonuclease
MKRKPLACPNDDIELFRNSVGDVRPVKTDTRVAPPRRRLPKQLSADREREEILAESLRLPLDSTEMETGEELLFRRGHVSRKAFRRLRRGQYRTDDELDLHHMTLANAPSALRDFLDEALAMEHTCVRIIHGKGLRSSRRGPVLKGLVNQYLRRHPAVLAFATTPIYDGGTGAVYVLLEQP